MIVRAGRLWVALGAVVAVLWLGVFLAVPGWIARDPERNMAALGLVGRRMTYPAFQHYWPRYHLVALALVLVVGGALLVLSTMRGQRFLNSLLGPLDDRIAFRMPGSGRSRVVTAVWLTILLPQLLAVVSGFEAWPFSPYGMYSAVQAPVVSVPRLAVMTDTGLVTVGDLDWLRPFDTSRLDVALNRLIRQGDQVALQQAAQFALGRYERARARAGGTWPQARGIGVYRDTWLLQPGASNRLTPDSTAVIFEAPIQ